MTRRRLLITGGTGLLGLNWGLAMRDLWDVYLSRHARHVALSGTRDIKVNLESIDAIRSVLHEVRPALVIHAAGLTSVENCEAHPEVAMQVNTRFAENVAVACESEKTDLVHVSTDHLFAGTTALVSEQEPVAPINTYARSKAESEIYVLAAHPGAIVVRTNFYGWGTAYRQSFSDRIIGQLRANREISLFEDVHFTPILVESLASTVHQIVKLRASGVFNVAGCERQTKYDFGCQLAEHFRLDRSLIRRSRLTDQEGLVNRPLDMSLSIDKLRRTCGDAIFTAGQDIRRLWEQERNGIAKELANI